MNVVIGIYESYKECFFICILFKNILPVLQKKNRKLSRVINESSSYLVQLNVLVVRSEQFMFNMVLRVFFKRFLFSTWKLTWTILSWLISHWMQPFQKVRWIWIIHEIRNCSCLRNMFVNLSWCNWDRELEFTSHNLNLTLDFCFKLGGLSDWLSVKLFYILWKLTAALPRLPII